MKHNAHLLSAACLLLCAAARGAEGQADPHALVQQLGAKYMYERQAAAAAIAKLDPATRQKLLPDLLKLIEEGNWLAQSAAAEALRRMGPAAADSAPRLLKVALAAFEARHQAVVELMLTTMVAVDANAAEGLVGPIAARLDGADAMEAAQLCGLLERIGPGAKAAVPALRKLLASKDPRQASAAARALGAIGPAAESAVGDLAACLASSDTLLAQAALGGLRGIGPAAKSAVGDIVGLLGSSDGVLRQAAVDALAGVGAAAVPALNGAVAGGKAGLAAAAADALG